MKRILTVQKKLQSGEWVTVSQSYCESEDIRQFVHTVATDDNTRVQPVTVLEQNTPLYNFCPPGSLTKIER
jgi:hypothetical protein